MAKNILQLLGFILLTICCKAQEFTNVVDSLGYKQGKWIEYKPLPTRIAKNGLKIYSADSSTVYFQDLYFYEGECYLEKQVGDYKYSLREGPWTLYWPSGKLKGHLNYSHGIPYGEFIIYYESGTPVIKGNISYDLHSKRETYDENGNLIRVIEGPPNGLIKNF